MTVNQRHRDRGITIDSTLAGTVVAGIPDQQVPFGKNPERTLSATSNFTFNSTTNILTTSGGFTTAGSIVSSTMSSNTLSVTGSATIGSATIGTLSVTGNETIGGVITAGSNSIAVTDSTGHVRVQALSAGPEGTFLTTDHFGVVNWGAYPSIAAGWTDNGTYITSNAGERVRVNSTSTGSEILSVGGDVVFTGTMTGNGSGLTTLNASNLASGIVPLAVLSGITSAQMSTVVVAGTYSQVTVDQAGRVTSGVLAPTGAIKSSVILFLGQDTHLPNGDFSDLNLIINPSERWYFRYVLYANTISGQHAHIALAYDQGVNAFRAHATVMNGTTYQSDNFFANTSFNSEIATVNPNFSATVTIEGFLQANGNGGTLGISVLNTSLGIISSQSVLFASSV